ncbi:hypothetical protein LG204_04815 [Methylovorus menthalis]|uniref:hypothetical protein n=1 Tax=Methylovorus menthalis TaxID=1002227 RepID=UPI001E2B5D6C|nr:hypothetical protein [Methylovorus menthalis]MCB4810632.1 hypothetical protein [Methylovorus menthalis]
MLQVTIANKVTPSIGKSLLIGGGMLTLWCALYIVGVSHYPGSTFSYSLFSFVFLCLLISGLIRRISYGYTFVAGMLFLGFWMKLTVHLWLNYAFRESTGTFDYSAYSWDETLDIASYAALCILATRILLPVIGLKSVTNVANKQEKELKVLLWYSQWRIQLWITLLLFCIFLAVFNASFGIFQIGLVPRTILAWPLNAVISYLIGHGLSILTCVFLWWEILLKKDIKYSIYFIIIIAFISTTSVLSRGIYIFQTLPQFFAAFTNRKIITNFSIKSVPLISITFITLLFVSNTSVNFLREHYYTTVNIPHASNSEATLTSKPAPHFVNIISGVASLLVDRWIGIEGLMVLQAHSEKSHELFIHGLQEHRKIGTDTLYSSISKPNYYLVVDKSKYQFSEIPGAIAFCFFSGKFWVVGLGMVLLTGLLLISEAAVMKLTGNPILCGLWGCLTANYFAQMGVAPKDALFPMSITAVAIIFVGFIQSDYFFRALSTFKKIHKK